jgi:hypothetical protein
VQPVLAVKSPLSIMSESSLLMAERRAPSRDGIFVHQKGKLQPKNGITVPKQDAIHLNPKPKRKKVTQTESPARLSMFTEGKGLGKDQTDIPDQVGPCHVNCNLSLAQEARHPLDL